MSGHVKIIVFFDNCFIFAIMFKNRKLLEQCVLICYKVVPQSLVKHFQKLVVGQWIIDLM